MQLVLPTFNLRPNSLLVLQSLWSNGFLGVLIGLKVFAVCVKRILSESTDSCFMTELSRYTAQETETSQASFKATFCIVCFAVLPRPVWYR